ncbi:MAG: hypothetical protein ACETWE_00225 [Candidatus Bathyarchaeia archaeon]
MKNSKLERIRRDIIKSGIPLEVEVSSILQQNKWFVLNQFPYVDKIEKKVRPIDVVSFRTAERVTPIMVLAIECKKGTDHPWTFYTTPKMDFWAGLATLISSLRKIAAKEMEVWQSPKSHLLDEDVRVATISYVPFGKKDDFFEAVNQVLRPLFSFSELMKDSKVKNIVTYPVIIYDGEIYEISVGDKDLAIKPIDYLQFVAGGTPEKLQPTLVDVMRKNHFPNFLKRLDQEFHEISQAS